MKTLVQHINEVLVKHNLKNVNEFNYCPKTRDELRKAVMENIREHGRKCDLNNIDVSNIEDMSELFVNTDFAGDVSEWDVSKVKDMSNMFMGCKEFNCDISNWNVSNVTDMSYMFLRCEKFNQDLSKWNTSKKPYPDIAGMFSGCDIDNKFMPKFK